MSTVHYARLRARRFCVEFCYTYARPYVAGGPAPVVRAGVVASRKVRA